MKWAKRVLLAAAVVLGAAVLLVGGYVGYMQLEYDRIPDGQALEITGQADKTLRAGEEYTALTYNIGFGAYGPEYSFFMDSGVMADGTAVQGKHGKARSKDEVQTNTAGAIEQLTAGDDLVLVQEVDQNADRSHHVDQTALITQAMEDYAGTFACNFHSAYIAYPFHDPHGATTAGMLTFSKFPVQEAVRRSYPVDESFFVKFTDLDRCFALLRIPVENGRELVLINSHMSAYDEGGTVRARQLEMLCGVLQQEYAAGNYVIVGGDFNHALGPDAATAFPCQQQFPGWVHTLEDSDLPDGFSIVTAQNETQVPTCRAAEIPWQPGVNYTTNVDGFIVSANVQAEAENIDTQFAYSDHNPVRLRFVLE